MTYANAPLLVVMVLSCLVQFMAAAVAMHLIRLSGSLAAWLLLAGGFFAQGVRRIISLFEVIAGQLQANMTVELLGLAISSLMFFGVFKFKPLFEEISRSRQALLDKQEKLTDTNRRLEEAQEYLQEANQNLSRLAILDGLTGIANRREFDQKLSKLWKSAYRNRNSLALLMIDIDHFKLFNDTYGHLCGDDCLRTVANIIQQSCLRPEDFVARYGGEEFAVLLPETPLDDARQVANRIQENLRRQNIPHTESILGKVTLSIGICSMQPVAPQSEQELVLCADRLLYQAKHSGRNLVCWRPIETETTL